jgi:large subunit ribosomal protein L22
MAEYKAKLSYLKISPRKVRLVAGLVRGISLDAARVQLRHSTKRSSTPLLKLLNSAASNAKDINEDLDEATLYIKEIRVDEGPIYKRYIPVARGSAHEIQKKSSHVTLILAERVSGKKQEAENKKEPKKEKTKQE